MGDPLHALFRLTYPSSSSGWGQLVPSDSTEVCSRGSLQSGGGGWTVADPSIGQSREVRTDGCVRNSQIQLIHSMLCLTCTHWYYTPAPTSLTSYRGWSWPLVPSVAGVGGNCSECCTSKAGPHSIGNSGRGATGDNWMGRERDC